MRIVTIALLLWTATWFGGTGLANATEVEVNVRYISASGIYLDAGSDRGIRVGDQVAVLRDGNQVATLEVTYLSTSSAVCRLVEGEMVRAGDLARVTLSSPQPSDGSELTADSVSVPSASPALPAASALKKGSTARSESRSKPRLSGRIGVQVMMQDDLENSNRDVTEPSLTGRLRAENLFDSHYTLSIRFRSRRVQRAAALSADTHSEWNNRIYEVSFGYDNPLSPLRYKAGRIISNRFAGVGTLDGAHLEFQQQNGLAYGLFGGTQPDFRTSRPGMEETKAGFYAAMERGNWQSTRTSGTLALAGRYRNGSVSQEFLYQQLQVSSGRSWSLYQSGELDIYRDWRRETEGKSIGLSNLLFSGRWRPTDALALDAGYDNRRIVRTWETRDTPDSLFDDALRQGYRAGMSYSLPIGLRLWSRAGLRVREGENRDTRNFAVGITQRNLLDSGTTVTMQVSTFENRYSSGLQPSLQMSRYFYRLLYLDGQVGMSRYEMESGSRTDYRFARLGASMIFTRKWYASLYGEAYRGDQLATNRLYVELGYRL